MNLLNRFSCTLLVFLEGCTAGLVRFAGGDVLMITFATALMLFAVSVLATCSNLVCMRKRTERHRTLFAFIAASTAAAAMAFFVTGVLTPFSIELEFQRFSLTGYFLGSAAWFAFLAHFSARQAALNGFFWKALLPPIGAIVEFFAFLRSNHRAATA